MLAPFGRLTATRIVYYEEPGRTAADAQTRALQAATPLDVTASAFPQPRRVPALSPPALLCLAVLVVGIGVRAAAASVRFG